MAQYVKKFTTEHFIKRAKAVHGDKYTYEQAEYKACRTAILVTCPTHGVFGIRPEGHIQNKAGCIECHYDRSSLTNEEFVERARKKHGNVYSYDEVEYFNIKTHVVITCQKHGDFRQLPSNHLYGTGCPTCGRARSNFGLLDKQLLTSGKS